jgi:hypothetical protein
MINWNVPMKDANQFYDRIVEIGNIESPNERRTAALVYETAMEDDLRKNAKPSPFKLLTGTGRGKAIGNILKSMLIPAIYAGVDAEHRVLDQQQLSRLATALEGYRVQHGAYPQSLEKLVPKYINEMPMDTFAGGKKPFRYESEGDSYLLYCLGRNTVDDGGNRDGDLVVQGPPRLEGAR